ncbi:unnamed protein product [Leptosia nina]|uniref:Uncharacterized protein n=1 Tax=Leptosia nina TaxID=320188 RepID=A0AAV1JSK3_9NEOP
MTRHSRMSGGSPQPSEGEESGEHDHHEEGGLPHFRHQTAHLLVVLCFCWAHVECGYERSESTMDGCVTSCGKIFLKLF